MQIYPNLTGQIFAQNLGSIVDRFEAQQKEQQQRARLDAAYSTIAEQLGFDKNYIKTTSLEEKQGLVKGKQMAAELQQSQDQSDESLDRQTQSAYMRRQQAAQPLWQQEAFGGDYDNAISGQQPMPSVMGMLQAGGRTGYNVPVGQLDDIMRATQSARAGKSFEDTTARVIPLRLSNGNFIDVLQAPGAHDFKFPPLETGAGLSQAVDPETGQPMAGVYLTPKGNPFTRKMPREPGEGPKMSKDGRFYWDEATQGWKPMRGDDAIQSLLEVIGGGAKPPAATGNSAPVMRFRRNAKGELERS